jgi:urease accessory protein
MMIAARSTGMRRDHGAVALVRLFQLASPALPIGAFAYSQGLERVVEDGAVRDLPTAQAWIGDLLELVIAPGEGAMAWRMLVAAGAEDAPATACWNARFRASRESSELRAETEQMGGSLLRLALDLELLDDFARDVAPALQPITLPAAWALSARGMGIGGESALAAYLWAWLENQAMAALKAIPLGQVAGQRLLWALGARIPAALQVAQTIADDDVASFAPGLAIASSRHETQYTRLFRS